MIEKEETIMQIFKTTILVTSMAALAGCASWDKSPICPTSHGWQAWDDVRCNADNAPKGNDMADRLAALEKDRQRLANELDAARKQNGALSSRVGDLERQLADRDREIAALRSGAGDSAKLASQLSAANSDKDRLAAQLAAAQGNAAEKERLAAELAAAKQRIADLENQLAGRDKDLVGLRGELSAEMAKLKEAQRGLIRALRPQINKGDIAIDLNDERLLINLASGYLFSSGQDELKPAGVNALKQVGMVLKDYQEYKVAVDGHTDNVPITGALKQKFPTNMELSESRAANAAKALEAGGLSTPATHGYADTKPVEPNATPACRAKNRRVEVRVTK
jgi:chemotaxis protein MotB